MTKEIIPILKDELSLDQNFAHFLNWAQTLQDPVGFAKSQADQIEHRDHAIGFTCYYLAKSQLYVARLHHYEKAAEIEKDVHDHAFDFKSGILSGRLIQTIYGIEQDETGSESLFCFDDADGVQQVEQAVQRYKIDPSEVQYFNVGDIYSLHPGIIHSVAVEDNTVTMMVKTQSAPFAKALVIKQSP